MQPEFGDVAEPGVGTTEFDLGAQPSTPEIPVVPETGVPGSDSVDAFCRDWSDFTGPYFARASAADEIVDVDVREALAASWLAQLAQLAEQGVDDPFLDVDFAGVADPTLFVAAVESFSTTFPSIVMDPSLITDVRIPTTGAYLGANCLDRGTLGGGDVIIGD